MSFTRIAGIVVACFGVLFLLYLFAWRTLVPPTLAGMEWWSTVLGKMVSQGAIVGTLIGTVCVVGGAFLLFQRPKQRLSVVSMIVMAVVAALIILGIALT